MSSLNDVGSGRAEEIFVDVLALTYHEARNVRWLLQEGLVERDQWVPLTQLAHNKFIAWNQLSDLRTIARESGVGRAPEVFEERFGCGVEDLAVLYEHEGWRNSAAVGGNAWRAIAAAVKDLRDALLREDESGDELAVEVLQMRHNTGLVGEKLEVLERGDSGG